VADDLIVASSTALWKATGTSLKTLAVSPAHLGGLMVFSTTYLSSASLTGLSGGGCPASGSGEPGDWQRIAGPLTNASSAKIEMWMGRVTSVGAATITMTIGTTGQTTRLNCKEFATAMGGSTTDWSLDGSAGSRNGTGTTDLFPSLTPAQRDRLYVGFGTNGGAANVGSQTSGYSLELDPGSNPFLYRPACPSSAQAPTCTQTTNSAYYLLGALIKADDPLALTAFFLAC